MRDLDDILVKIDADTEPFKRTLADNAQDVEDMGIKFGESFNRGFDKSLQQSTGNMGSRLAKQLMGGGLGGLGAMAESLASSFHQNMTNALLRNAVFNPLKSGIMGGLFGGRATGGSVNSGQPYVVGEHGPELFVPEGKGRIDPRGAKGQGVSAPKPATNVTINIQTPSSDHFKESQSQTMAEISRHLERSSLYR